MSIFSLVDPSDVVRIRLEFPQDKSLAWNVETFSIREGMQMPYEVELALFASNTIADPRELLGMTAVFWMERGFLSRRLVGIIDRVERAGLEHGVVQGNTKATVRLVPAFRLLDRNKHNRVYQQMTVPEILEDLFENTLEAYYHRKHSLDGLKESYPQREYCVQFQESDMAFAERLMAEEGISYWFSHNEDAEVLQLADHLEAYPAFEGAHQDEVHFLRHEGKASGAEGMAKFEEVTRLGNTGLHLRDYEWSSATPMDETREDENIGAHRMLDWSGRALTFSGWDEGVGEYMENDAQVRGRVYWEALKQRDALTRGSGNAVTMHPGHVFALTGHPDPALNASYVVTELRHRGSAVENGGLEGGIAYENQVWCMASAAGTPFRPLPPETKPRVLGIQTAQVVGPESETIFTDAYGRIKVQFQWDRVGKRDDHSSCFVRVAQGMAGNGWGMLFLPRRGMEVVVSFVDGDPDRPVVTGCLYNGVHKPPYLPDEKTKSTIRSQTASNKDGEEGFNEFRFEDAPGAEEIFLHAERNLNEVVKQAHSTSVGGDQSLTVSGDRNKSVEGEETQTIQKSQTIDVEMDRTVTITGKDTLTVEGGLREETLHQGFKRTVDTGDSEELVSGGDKKVTISAGSYTLAQQQNTLTADEAGISFTSPSNLVLTGDASIELVCGSSRIVLTPDKVEIHAPTISITGDTITTQSGGSSIEVTSSAVTAKSPAIHMN